MFNRLKYPAFRDFGQTRGSPLRCNLHRTLRFGRTLFATTAQSVRCHFETSPNPRHFEPTPHVVISNPTGEKSFPRPIGAPGLSHPTFRTNAISVTPNRRGGQWPSAVPTVQTTQRNPHRCKTYRSSGCWRSNQWPSAMFYRLKYPAFRDFGRTRGSPLRHNPHLVISNPAGEKSFPRPNCQLSTDVVQALIPIPSGNSTFGSAVSHAGVKNSPSSLPPAKIRTSSTTL